MRKLAAFSHVIGNISEWSGRIVSYVVIFIIVAVMAEIILRYFFLRPTIWSHELSEFLFSGLFLLGGAYAFRHGAFVNVDIIVGRLPPRTRTIIKLATSILFFFFCVMVIWKGGEFAWSSWLRRERSISIWAPPVYQVKMLIPIGVFLVLIQGLANFFEDLAAVYKKGKAM